MLNSKAFDLLGPRFVRRGWVFFAPYRRGQGLSASAGPYVGDQIAAAIETGGVSAGSAVMARLLETDHLSDQLAALAWLRKASFVSPTRIATAGNSFGGIEAILGVERERYCAAIAASAGAQSWATSPKLRALLTRAARNSLAPVFLFQAENDFDISANRVLAAAMRDAGVQVQVKLYPAFGSTAREGHSFAWRGSAIWFEDAIRFLERHCAP
jgi:dienelactone hydrolase